MNVRALLLLLLTTSHVLAHERPDDAATMEVAYPADHELEAGSFLAGWGRRFGALVIPTPLAAGVKIKILTPIQGPLTWGAAKAMLQLHDVALAESPTPGGGPWIIRAWDRRREADKRDLLPPGIVPRGEVARGDELVTAVVPVRHGAGVHIFAHLRALTQNQAGLPPSVLHVPVAEVILIVDTAPRVRWLAGLVEALDVPGPRRELLVLQLDHAPVEQVAVTLGGVLSAAAVQGGPVVGPHGLVAPIVFPDPRSNKLVVSALPHDLTLIKGVVAELDVLVPLPTGRLHVYPCQAAEATELAQRIQELLGGVAITTAGGAPQAAGAPAPTSVNEVATRIVADPGTNTLLVHAEEAAWRDVQQVLFALDRRRRRVLIEAEVWEVFTPTDQLSLGVELLALDDPKEGSIRAGGASSFGLSSLSVRSDAQGRPIGLSRTPALSDGLTAVLTKDAFDRLPLIVRALHTYETARLLTRPFSLSNHDEKASFVVSDQVPYILQDVIQGTGAPTVASRVVYADATTRLEIEPLINSDHTLTLQLTLELTSFSGGGGPGLPPGRSTRTYTGKVTVQSGRYAIFGGLESESERTSERRVPLLGEVPILGHLFKSSTRDRNKARLYVFIRPTVFAEDDPAAEERLAEHLRERVQVEAGRETWLPPLVTDRIVRGLSIQDEAFEVFGTGSGYPF